MCEVKTSEEFDLYSVGTLCLTSSYDPQLSKGQLVMESTDADSYRYHTNMTEIVQVGNGSVSLENDYMPVVPTIITTEETLLSWKVGEDQFRKTLSAGTWVIPEMELIQGTNTISVETKGSVTFSYREGCL